MGLLYKIIMYLISLYNEKMADKKAMEEQKKEKTKRVQQMFKNWLYLLDQRNAALMEIQRVQKADSAEMIKCQKDLVFNKKQMFLEKDKVSRSNVNWSDYLKRHKKRESGDKRQKRQNGECPYKEYKNIVRNLERKIHPDRAKLIDKKFMENVGRYVKSFEDEVSDAEMSIRHLSSNIEYSKKIIENLADEICKFTKNGMLSLSPSTREEASTQIAIRQLKIEKELKSIEDSKKEILTWQSKESVAREKATSLREEMGYTLESFVLSLERLRERIKKNNDEQYDVIQSLDSKLFHFEKNQTCIRELEKLINDVDSNLPQIREAVKKNSRPNMSGSFDISTKRVKLCLGVKEHDITLTEYLYHLKAGTRVRDIQNIQSIVPVICSKINEQIASHSIFDPDVEFLRGKIKHYNELLEEKKRSCE
jgi:hypothetical protein